MKINFDKLVVETFDDSLIGEVKGTFKFKNIKTLDDSKSRLGDQLRSFVIKEIKKGNLPFAEEKNMLYALVKDKIEGEITCLIKPESIQ